MAIPDAAVVGASDQVHFLIRELKLSKVLPFFRAISKRGFA
jgi:hypothetical protein